jgi:L-seryl-tRNA(Ser) seleniumtransferase
MARVSDTELLRRVPQVDAVLRIPTLAEVERAWGPAVARRLVHEEIERAREAARRGREPGDAAAIADAAAARAVALGRRRLRRVINATGVILHTNLGRAPLGDEARAAALEAAGAVALEFDLGTGERGSRAPVASFVIAALTGAEDALVVNNNAGALLLALAALARGREVIVSRGELIEIGGEFRLPEVMEASGAILREIGTTNRTHSKDYRRAISGRTGLILKVHPSNYQVVGFTAAPPLEEIVAIGHEAALPVLYDIGSGLLAPEKTMPEEPDAASALRAGADLVCYSGDKLLGGQQAGVLAGRKDLVELCRRNPIARAVRADKLTLAAMEATVLAHARGERAAIPVARMIDEPVSSIRARADALAASIPGTTVIDGESVTGGGSLPGRSIPTALLAVELPKPDDLATRLRGHDPPVIARVEGGRLVLDLRTVRPEEEAVVVEALLHATQGAGE